MITVRISGLPDEGEDRNWHMCTVIEAALQKIKTLGLTGTEGEILVLYAADNMKKGLGKEILIEVLGLLQNSRITRAVKRDIMQALWDIVYSVFPHAANICCLIHPLVKPGETYCTSADWQMFRCRFYTQGGPEPLYTRVFDTEQKPYEKQDKLPTMPLVLTLTAKSTAVLVAKVNEAEARMGLTGSMASNWATHKFPAIKELGVKK